MYVFTLSGSQGFNEHVLPGTGRRTTDRDAYNEMAQEFFDGTMESKRTAERTPAQNGLARLSTDLRRYMDGLDIHMVVEKCRIPQIQIVRSGLYITEDAHRLIGLKGAPIWRNNLFTIDKMKLLISNQIGIKGYPIQRTFAFGKHNILKH